MISSLFDIFNSVCLECGCLCYIHSLPGTKIFPKLLLFPLFSDVIYGIVYWGFLCIIACTNYLSMKMKELCIYLCFSRRVDYCISIILSGVGVYQCTRTKWYLSYIKNQPKTTTLPPSRTSSSPSSNQFHQGLPLLVQNSQPCILNNLPFQPRPRPIPIPIHNTLNSPLPPPLTQSTPGPPNNHPLLHNRPSRHNTARADLGVLPDTHVRVHRGQTVNGRGGVDARA